MHASEATNGKVRVMVTQRPNQTFSVRFVATERGVKAEGRVKGRFSFPSNRGPQPRAGETWLVKIGGENPRKTVFFLACIEQVNTQPNRMRVPLNVELAVPLKVPLTVDAAIRMSSSCKF